MIKFRIKQGENLISSIHGLHEGLIVNLWCRWSFIEFWQKKRSLFIRLKEGLIELRSTSDDLPDLEFDYQEKDQLIFKRKNMKLNIKNLDENYD